MTGAEKKEVYRSLCAEGKITDLFMQPWWLDCTGEWEVALAVRNGQVTGAMPYALSSKWGMRMITMPHLTHHLLIWMEKPEGISDRKWLTREKQTIWLLIDDLPRYAVFSMVFEARSFSNWLPFHWKGFRQEVRYTFEIERKEAQDLDEQLNRNLRRSLKATAEKMSVVRGIVPGTFYDICRNTYRRQNMKMPYSLDELMKIDTAVTNHQAGVALGATNQKNELVAVAYLLWDRERAYYFLAGDTEEGKSAGASIFLCREALRIAFDEKELSTFDFCGSMIESITEVRRQFGAKPVVLMKLFKAGYKWLDILYTLTR